MQNFHTRRWRLTLVLLLISGFATSCVQREKPSQNTRSPAQGSGGVEPSPLPSPSPDIAPDPDQRQPSLPDLSQPEEQLPETCIGGVAELCAAEKLISDATNAYRARATTLFGSPSPRQPLTHNEKLSAVARDWSKRQAEAGRISHDGFSAGDRLRTYLRLFNNVAPSFRIGRENVAMTSYGGTSQQIANSFATMWYKSWGHRVNMLAESVTITGVGVYKDPRTGRYYATQLFGQ